AACIRSDELKGQDRYEAGQVFEATSADDMLPVEFSGGVDFDALRAEEVPDDGRSEAGAVSAPDDATYRPVAPTPSPLGDAGEIQDPAAAPATERITRDGDQA